MSDAEQRGWGDHRGPALPGKRVVCERNLRDAQWDDSGALVWLEDRGGRGMLLGKLRSSDTARELCPGRSARGGVNYGGGAFGVRRGSILFVDQEDGQIHRCALDSERITAIAVGDGRTASPSPSPDGRWLLCVRSTGEHDSIQIADASGVGAPRDLVRGDNFYMQPAWHPDGRKVAWVAWNHPNSPWDGTSLSIGSLGAGSGPPELADSVVIAGGEGTAIFQPEFSPDGRVLAYVSDESGWWQIYARDLVSGEVRQLTAVEAEHGRPAWAQGMRTFGFAPDGSNLYFIRNERGFATLWSADLGSGQSSALALPAEYTWLEQIAVSPFGQIALIASGPSVPARLITVQPAASARPAGEKTHVIRRSMSVEVPGSRCAQPEAIAWRAADGATVHGLYYPPVTDGEGESGPPPLLVNVHGGPADQCTSSYDRTVTYFAGRGIAVLGVNYRGSSGYGRDYRRALDGGWGVIDVEDAISGARHLVGEGLADASRLAIMGDSAGGFTVLRALQGHPGFFRVGIDLYGPTCHFDFLFADEKFERHYNETLLGPYPQAAEKYRERSPLLHAERITDPLIVFHGEDDFIIPQSHSERLIELLHRTGAVCELHTYAGEGHGFTGVEAVAHFLSATEAFLQRFLTGSDDRG